MKNKFKIVKPRKFRNFFAWLRWFAAASFAYVTEHWPRYLLSMVTATFTGQAAYVLTGQLYYVVMAILLCEGMMLYWFSRLEIFENWKQAIIASLMFVLGCVAIVSTDIASAVLIAHRNSTFEFYSVLPVWVEKLVTNITPILASTNLIFYGVYEFLSDTNADKRYHAAQARHVIRTIRATERDMQKMRARKRILVRKRQVERLEAKHQRQFGDRMVSSVSKRMKLETDDTRNTGIPFRESIDHFAARAARMFLKHEDTIFTSKKTKSGKPDKRFKKKGKRK